MLLIPQNSVRYISIIFVPANILSQFHRELTFSDFDLNNDFIWVEVYLKKIC